MAERFTCPRCGRSSSHPDDIANGYCGACHDFTAAMSANAAEVIERSGRAAQIVTTVGGKKQHLAEPHEVHGLCRAKCGAARLATEDDWNKHFKGPRQEPIIVTQLPRCRKCFPGASGVTDQPAPPSV